MQEESFGRASFLFLAGGLVLGLIAGRLWQRVCV